LEQAGVQLKYDHNQVFPRLDVFGSYGYGSGGVDNTSFGDAFRDFRNRELPAYSYGALISVPLINSTARNKYKSAKVVVQQALLAVRQTEETIMVEIDNAVTAAKVSYQRVDATRQGSSYAEAALEAEQRKLEIGKSTSFNVLQLQRNLTEARTQEIIARADYTRALAELARAEGSTLDRRAIDVQAK
jgi:outer membrane protein